MRTIRQQADGPIGEDWVWQTNIIVSDDGTEQRIMLNPYPKRTVRMTLGFDTDADVREMMTTLLVGYQAPMLVPFWQAQARITALAAATSSTLTFSRQRTDVRDGQAALLVARDGTTEQVEIDTVTATGCELVDPLENDWRPGSLLVPLWPMSSAGGGSLTRFNPDYAAVLTLSAEDTGFMIPFLDEYAEVELATFSGLPVLDRPALGTSFETGADTGAEWFDYGGVVEVRSPWKHTQFVMPREFLVQRVLSPAAWSWWRTFADWCKGSLNPFWLPSGREDFAVAVAPAPNGNTLRFAGLDYLEHYWPHACFKQIAIYSELGVHYAGVTAAVAEEGNTQVTFAPALPNVAGWANEQKVSLLLKARIADDKIAVTHGNLDSRVAVNLRTVDA